ncbi:PLP-dependent aminotransferase family protein [Frankia sp. CiP3]|uniref:aminotransferase-like domain-containing protein n=1 Tax=Frankia sp. CiP3 TaxID=2880971 RepID=UPI0035B00789
MEVMNFLNEITSRHPEAISFGPGRPYEGLFKAERIGDYLDAYTHHLRDDLGRTPAEVRTLLFQYGRTNGQIHHLVARTLHNDEGIQAHPESLVVTVGCQEGMFITLRALFARPSDVLLVPSPCYIGITGAARLLNIETAPVPEGEDGIDPEALRRTVAALRAAGKRPRALYVIPDFSNPTGIRMTLPARHRLLELAEDEDLLLLEDNPYGFFTRSTGTHRPTLKALDTRRRVIYLGSFAKTCFPGARVGYVVADQHVRAPDGRQTLLAEELSKVKSMVTVNTPALSQAVIGGMLITHGFRLREANDEAAGFYRQNLDVLLDCLDHLLPASRRQQAGIRWNAPEGGFFLTLTLPIPADNALLERSARDHGVIWTPMSYFYPDGGGRHQMRLSLSSLTRDQVTEGAHRLVSLLERNCR